MPNTSANSTLTEPVAQQHPRARALVADLRATAGPLLGRQIDDNIARHGEGFWQEAERLLTLAADIPGDPREALLEYTLSYLREQAQFLSSQEYSNTDFAVVQQDVYDNPDVMERFYLLGLLMTHAFWSIPFDRHAFFRREFLPRVPEGGFGGEIGYGHGLFLHDVLTARPGATTVSIDISRYAQSFADRLLRAGGVDPGRFELRLGDARERLPYDDDACSWLVCAEVLEHIPDPAAALTEVRRCLAPGATALVTTVVDSNTLDHLYRFTSPDEVRDMVAAAGLTLVADQTFAVRDYDPNSRDPSIDIAIVCAHRGA